MSNSNFNLGDRLPTLPAGRVQLRALEEEDVPALFRIFGDLEVTRYWGHAALPDLRAAADYLAEIGERFAAGQLFQWGVVLPAANLVIGTCSLASLDGDNCRADLGFALERAFWGRGYMREALQALLRFGFTELSLHRLAADADPRNTRSIRMLEQFGFRREGYLREHYLVQGEPQDSILFGLLRSEWKLGLQEPPRPSGP